MSQPCMDYSKNAGPRRSLTMIQPNQTQPLMTRPNGRDQLIHPWRDPLSYCLISYNHPLLKFIIQPTVINRRAGLLIVGSGKIIYKEYNYVR